MKASAFSNFFRARLLVLPFVVTAGCVHPAPVVPVTATDPLANVPLGAPVPWAVPTVELPSLEAEVEQAVLEARGRAWGGTLSARWKHRPAIEYYEDPLFEDAAFSAASALHVPAETSISVSHFRIFREVAYYDIASHRIIARSTIHDPRWVPTAIKHSFGRALATALAWDEHGAVVDDDKNRAVARYGQALRLAEASRTADAAFPEGTGRISLREFGRLPTQKPASGTRRGDLEDLLALTWGPKAATFKGEESLLTPALFDDFLRREARRLLAAPRDAADERALYADPPRTLTTALDRAAWSTPPKAKVTAKDGWTVTPFLDGSYETALLLALGTLDEDSVFRCARAVRGVYYAEMPVKPGPPKDDNAARPGARCYVYSADSVGEAAGRCLQRTLEGLREHPVSWSTAGARVVCSDAPEGFAQAAEQALTVTASPSDATPTLVLPPAPSSAQGWIPLAADRSLRAALRPPGGLPASFSEGRWATGGHSTNVLFRKEPLEEALARAAGIAEIFDNQLGDSEEAKKEMKQAMHGYPAMPTVLRDQLVAFGRPLPAARLRRSWLATGRRLDVWVAPFAGAMLTVIVRHASETETDDRPEIGNPEPASVAPQGRP